MSKIIDSIKYSFTGREYPVRSYITTYINTNESPAPMAYDRLKEYKIGVEYAVTVKCLDKDISNAKRNVIQELREFIYGDMRGKVLLLQRSLYENEIEDAYKIIDEIMEEMAV